MELLMGCGHRRDKIAGVNGNHEWDQLTTLDHNPLCKPDILHDLNESPYPFGDNTFDEIHAYEVLEHLGRQGDARYFFNQWDEIHRILIPGGYFFGTVPKSGSVWVWGDPSHTRTITREQLAFLDRDFYKQLGATPSSDFRGIYKGDFKLVHSNEEGESLVFVLQARK